MNFDLLKKKLFPPPFVPDLYDSYFDTDYLTKHLKENPESLI